MNCLISTIKYSITKPIQFKSRRSIYKSFQNFHTMKRDIHSSISLNDTELKIRNLLVDFCEHYNSNCEPNKDLVLRITGGWVRDKLLGNESNDLDIAINHLSGEEFASRLHSYLDQYHPSLTLKAIHTIKKNPEKSKHLETCTTKLFGLDIDFVNLRSEEYTTDSRVPIIECGTAEEDALRRDATLNALFYNINQGIIEDFTGKGLDDLRNGILRTPLQPLQTFLDDPLRVLRLIRFASRFDFLVESETLESMTNDEIKSTLVHKISRERIGVEVEKILTSKNPEYGLHLINYVGLTKSIFNAGPFNQIIEENNNQDTLNELNSCAQNLSSQLPIVLGLFPVFQNTVKRSNLSSFHEAHDAIFNDKQLKKLFWLCAILQPYKSFSVKSNAKRVMRTQMVEIILKEGLRFGKHEFDPVSTIVKESQLSHEILDRFFTDPEQLQRSELGLYLKQFDKYSALNIVFNCFNDIVQEISHLEVPNTLPSPVPVNPLQLDTSVITKYVQRYECLLDAIIKQELTEVHIMRPLIDGKTLSKELSMKPGPWMGKINSEILVWQLDNPSGSKDECISYVKEILPKYI
ncbi:unnamed protein product [Debaryomyces tyrocola]|nr:unnamed protein product [Debaryomyces tyrocola]